MEIKDEVMANAEMFSPLAWPMLIEPNDWEPHRAGGYLLNEVMKGHDMVRRGGPRPYTGGNHLQVSQPHPEGWLQAQPLHC